MSAVDTPTRPAATPALGEQALFLVWGPPAYGPRSRVLARELGLSVHHVGATPRRGAWIAPLKYAAAAVQTLGLLARERPRVVFVQSPPSPAVVVVALWMLVARGGYVVDAHSGALQLWYWTWPRWLHDWSTRRAVTTIVTGQHLADEIRASGGHATILPDVPTTHPIGPPPSLGDGFHVAVVSSVAPDEPLEAITDAARRLPAVTFHVTGSAGRLRERLPHPLPPNVELTGYLPDEDYFALLACCEGVMCLTTRDHTMQCGACEALALGTPLITSRWPVLEEYFTDGTVHVEATVEDIAQGVTRLQEHHEDLRAGIRALRARRRAEWDEIRVELLDRLAPLLGDGGQLGAAATTRR